MGSGLNDEGRLSLLVRAYEARTGQLLWEDELNPVGGAQGHCEFRITVRYAATLFGRLEFAGRESKCCYRNLALSDRGGILGFGRQHCFFC